MPKPAKGKAGPVRARDAQVTRNALLEAGARLFAQRGLDGARVGAIARAAGVNPAMINYHFGGKRKLYLAILTQALMEVSGRLQPLLASREQTLTLLERFIATFMHVMVQRPFVPAILVQEMMTGGRQVDHQLLPHFLAVFGIVRQIVERGMEQGDVRAVHPALTHLTLVGSLLFFFITLPVRERLDREGLLPIDMPGPEAFARHTQELMVRGLAAGRP